MAKKTRKGKPMPVTAPSMIKETGLDIPPEELGRFNEAYLELLTIIGDYTEKIGKLEKNNPKTWIIIQQVGNSPQKIFDVISKLPKANQNIAYKLMAELTLLLSSLGRIDKMNANEKIALGQNIKKLAEELRRMASSGSK